MSRNFLVIDPEERADVLRGLASPVRVRILRLLHRRTGVNVNDIADALDLPQSTVSSNLQILESAGLIRSQTQKGRKGNQKLCFSAFDEVLVMFRDDLDGAQANVIEVAMPIGLYTSCEVTAPCGLCSPQGIIGLLDVPGTFLNPDRMNAGLMWFTRGFVEYQFPNNARILGKSVVALEFSLELSSEVPGTSADWPSDITIAINGREVGMWTSPGDFGDQAGRLYARLVEAEGQPVRQAQELARHARGRLRRRGENLGGDAWGSRHFGSSFDPAEDRGQARRPASRRGQHLRPRLRQLRSGHRVETDDRAVNDPGKLYRGARFKASRPSRRTDGHGFR